MISKLLGNPYVLAGLAVASFASGWLVNGWRHDAAQEKAVREALVQQTKNYAERDLKHVAQQAADEALAKTTGQHRADLESFNARILSAIQTKQFVIREAPTDEKPCPDVRRNDAYRLCFNAAQSGDAAALAACEASGGHGAVPGQ